jgi:hypothetical protein
MRWIEMQKRMMQRGFRIYYKEPETRKNESVPLLRFSVSKFRKSRLVVIGEEPLKPASMPLTHTGWAGVLIQAPATGLTT